MRVPVVLTLAPNKGFDDLKPHLETEDQGFARRAPSGRGLRARRSSTRIRIAVVVASSLGPPFGHVRQ
jgi:hypothetical protein